MLAWATARPSRACVRRGGGTRNCSPRSSYPPAARARTAGQLSGELAARDHYPLLRIDWTEPAGVPATPPKDRIAVVGTSDLGSELHDAAVHLEHHADLAGMTRVLGHGSIPPGLVVIPRTADRKSTRLNSSHEWISYAVFCLKKKMLCLFFLIRAYDSPGAPTAADVILVD